MQLKGWVFVHKTSGAHIRCGGGGYLRCFNGRVVCVIAPDDNAGDERWNAYMALPVWHFRCVTSKKCLYCIDSVLLPCRWLTQIKILSYRAVLFVHSFVCVCVFFSQRYRGHSNKNGCRVGHYLEYYWQLSQSKFK